MRQYLLNLFGIKPDAVADATTARIIESLPAASMSATATLLDKVVQTLPTPISEIKPVVSEAALPCERQFNPEIAPDDPTLDKDFIGFVEQRLKRSVRYIPQASLRRTAPGPHGVPFPMFCRFDPFMDLSEPRRRAAIVMEQLRHDHDPSFFISDIDARVRVRAKAAAERDFGGILSLRASRDYTIENSGITLNGNTNNELERLWMKAPGRYVAVYYTMLPGLIPAQARDEIRALKKVADACGARVALIAEANWKLAEEAILPPRSADPLICLVKGDTTIYISRFDCTAAEESLAREHAVKP